MAGFKVPDFNERTAASRDAKARALEKLRNKAVADPEVIAARQAAREAAEAERREAHKAAIEQKKAAKEEARAKARAEAEAAAEAAAAAAAAKRPPHVPTAAELKALRDARYAARKARQR